MATFTKIAEDVRPSITLNPSHIISKIDDNVYGGFTEHMGRCIYGGIYDPGNPLSDENGFRKDVIEAFKELNCPVVRYPGGNFVATYHWIDGVGPKEKRPKRHELAWVCVESNEFGTDEFMKWCEVVGAEPYLALNFGTGTLDEALAWVEYCNSDKDTYYANLRRQNGREKPYNVRYWALGNEMWGPWQVGQMTKEDYAKQAYQWAKALKLLDPSIELILCGETGFSSWDTYVIKECITWNMHGLGGSTTASLIDMHSIHLYTASENHLENATAPRAAERAIEITGGLIDLARIENKVPPTCKRQKVCFDEWNVWDPTRAPGEEGGEEAYTLSDALAVGVWLNVFVRQAKYVGMANIAQSVNVISPLMTTKEGITKQTTWWPLLLFSKYMRGSTIATHVRSPEYEGATEPNWIRGAIETPYLDVSATVDDNGFVNLAVVNIHETKSFTVDLEGVKEGADIQVYTVTGENVGVVNKGDENPVGIAESTWDGKGAYEFQKASVTLLRWKH
ncbi:alpha-L-arabinofuranosidase [Colletotrichum graminicola]|uniref:non-reducing end alpha-L-arabinofuranosidase n=1 Tax=Colletotrichum graminicola (strain M1.001 / M2 / FGSC 10212) TaxID=645133 RepID=E3Q936_COLGM|nr:alpha-L-arabinofuranosidase [Colletotrichum graminicola M1.001]EFQ27215.1 alpha-L-arabinofuranosidase [Colletotrichum graminicola M1.001]WDK12983.1 alpha-L-arabinofuranosidase [Colletotrichum graminicola]